jgi:hypothetical protein
LAIEPETGRVAVEGGLLVRILTVTQRLDAIESELQVLRENLRLFVFIE